MKTSRYIYLAGLLALPGSIGFAQFGEDIDLDNDGIWDLNSGSGTGWRLNDRDIDLDNDGIWDLNQANDRDLNNDGIWDLNVGDNDWDVEVHDNMRGPHPIRLPDWLLPRAESGKDDEDAAEGL